jgi:hypothetical protein
MDGEQRARQQVHARHQHGPDPHHAFGAGGNRREFALQLARVLDHAPRMAQGHRR